jgi:lysophospholipase L1-like esterase
MLATLLAVVSFGMAVPTMAQPLGTAIAQADTQTNTDLHIVWEVKNRFRLFRQEKDFQLHVDALAGRTVLAAEQLMALESEGRGWARNIFGRLCIDAVGRIPDQCERDGTRESYLAPVDHRIGVRLEGPVPANANCAWNFEDGQGAPQVIKSGCDAEVALRVREGARTAASVEISGPDGNVVRISTEILARDVLIAGLGDSIGSGDGNPDRPVALSDDGFCFLQFLGGESSAYFRPGRAGFKGDKSCDGLAAAGTPSNDWARLSARWMDGACHRSLYSYQIRAALALAVETPHASVTVIPLACTGASVESGLFGSQRGRELNCGGNTNCPGTVPAQLTALQNILTLARRNNPARQLDLMFLTIGANDINFSGLVADVIIERRAERAVFSRAGIMSTVETAEAAINQILPREFAKLRTALKPLVGGNLERVVFVSYGHPALAPNGGPCPGGRDGFDVHPAFGIDADRMRRVAEFVQTRFLPRLKSLATCSGDVLCSDPSNDRMTFVDAHQPLFAEHGICARAETDPDFDKDCFSATGDSFATSMVEAATDPLVCERSASEFRAYAPRARWIRTANDSYFAAMTFPEGIDAARPRDIHDATWGILSAVYGGAVHPTAEGHAAMADAALPAARSVLGLASSERPITAQPLQPLPSSDASPQ